MRCERITITTDGAGAADVVSGPISGLIREIRLFGTVLNDEAKADFTITRRDDGASVLALTDADGPWSRSPRQATHDVAGAAAETGEAATLDLIPIDGHLRVQVAQALAGKTGILLVYYEDC